MPSTEPLKQEQAKEKMDEISRILRERGALSNCPRCGRNDWQADLVGYFVATLPITGVTIPPPHIPVLNLTCRNCGSTQLHNLNVLGIEL